MTNPQTIPSGSRAVIDSSVLFAMGGPDNEKFQAFQRFALRQDVSVYMPEAVAVELGEQPNAYRYQRDRLRAAREAGWLTTGQIDFSDPDVCRIVDRTRERMAKRSAADVTEDEIERADTVLAGLTYQYATGPASYVTVFVSDILAERAIRDVLSATDVSGRTRVVEGRAFLDELMGSG